MIMKRIILLIALTVLAISCDRQKQTTEFPFDVPKEYLEEREDIPVFWKATTYEIEEYIKTNVKKGQWEMLGKSAGGRPIYCITYGIPRKGKGTSTYSGASPQKRMIFKL